MEAIQCGYGFGMDLMIIKEEQARLATPIVQFINEISWSLPEPKKIQVSILIGRNCKIRPKMLKWLRDPATVMKHVQFKQPIWNQEVHLIGVTGSKTGTTHQYTHQTSTIMERYQLEKLTYLFTFQRAFTYDRGGEEIL